MKRSLLFFAGLLSLANVQAAPSLYSTGPDEPSAYIRFVNVGSAALQLGESGQELAAGQASMFQTVRADQAVNGRVSSGAQQTVLTDSLPEGSFFTVVLAAEKETIDAHRFLDDAVDFSAARATLTFYNAAPVCQHADLKVKGRDLRLVKDVATGHLGQRQINPAELALEVQCAGHEALLAVPEQGLLQAGERYSVILYQDAAAKPSVLWLQDKMQD